MKATLEARAQRKYHSFGLIEVVLINSVDT